MRAANEGSFDTTKLNEALLQAVEAPLPPAGWAGSRAEALAVAALVVDDITRTQDYLAKFKGSESPGVAAGLQRLNGILELREKFKTGRPELDALIKTWNAQGEDLLGRQSLRPLLEGLASGLVNENSTKVVPLNIGEYLTGTAAAPGAEEFWTRVLASMVPSLMTASDPKTNDFGVLAGLFEILFKKPGYAFTIWMRAAELQATTTPLDPTRATSFYERAWAAAINDEQRVRSAKLAIAGYMKVYEFVRARAVADATAKDLKDPAQKKLLDPVLAELNEKESKDAKRVAVQEKQIELNRRQGRLQNMKDLLVRAKRDKKPTEEIQALEQAVRDLEREVSE
jgi:hypothetical protein